MSHTSAVLLFFLISHPFVNAQPPIQWKRALGGTGDDRGLTICTTNDGGYFLSGSSNSNNGDVSGNHGNNDAWTVKLNSSGTIQWQKSLGGNYEDVGRSIRPTSDGGGILAASSNSTDGDVSGNHGEDDFWIVKLDNAGAIEWQKSLGGSKTDVPTAIQTTIDGGFVVVGFSNSNDGNVSGNHGNNDFWVVKLDNLGAIQWQKSLGGISDDQARSVRQTSDGGYMVAGETSSNNGDVSGNHGGIDYWIVKLDSSGALEWQRTLGGSAYDMAFSVRQTMDGGYIAAGSSGSNDGDISGNHGITEDYWVVKMENTGAIQWQKALGGSSIDYGYSLDLTNDGGYIIGGFSYSTNGDVSGWHGDADYWLVKLNSTGAIQWQKALGGTLADFAYAVIQSTDGGYVAAGAASSNNGDVMGNHNGFDYWIVKLSPTTSVTDLADNITWQLSPNPTSDFLEITGDSTDPFTTIALYNAMGIEMTTLHGRNNLRINLTNYPVGTYWVVGQTQSGIITRKTAIKH